MLTVAPGLPGLVIVGAAYTVQVNAEVLAVAPAASRTVIVELVVPAVVGVPVTVAPVMLTPAGKLLAV